MAENSLKPIRRVVTGNDQLGRSKVVWEARRRHSQGEILTNG